MKLMSALAAALLLTGSGLASADYQVHYKVNGLKSVSAPEVSGPFNSCKDLKAKKPGTANGVHPITVGGNTFDVYCDMTTAGGGWTMVVAQFEADPVTNWNEGIQADYDPSLATRRGFALSSAQLPAHTQTAFGSDFAPTAAEYFDYFYTTGNIPATLVAGLRTGLAYHIHRDTGRYHGNHDPESTYSSDPAWDNSLTIDVTGGVSRTFAFSPNAPLSKYRGHALNGLRSEENNSFAWTVWVR